MSDEWWHSKEKVFHFDIPESSRLFQELIALFSQVTVDFRQLSWTLTNVLTCLFIVIKIIIDHPEPTST